MGEVEDGWVAVLRLADLPEGRGVQADGRVLRGPAAVPLSVYEVRVTGDVLEVRPRP